MAIDTINVRFPRRLHTAAKIAASARSMPLQAFLETCVDNEINRAKGQPPLSPTVMRLAELDGKKQALVRLLLDLIEVAPSRYIRDLQQYMQGLLNMLRSPAGRTF